MKRLRLSVTEAAAVPLQRAISKYLNGLEVTMSNLSSAATFNEHVLDETYVLEAYSTMMNRFESEYAALRKLQEQIDGWLASL